MSTIVPKAHRPAYLANVLCIAKVTGDVASTESLVLRSIVHGIGGTRDDVLAAGSMLAGGHYQLQIPETPAARIANLQDMVMVALADGDLSPLESDPIEKMAKAMGYGQTDMDMVVTRARNALQRIGRHPKSFSREDEPFRGPILEKEDIAELEEPPPLPTQPPPLPEPEATPSEAAEPVPPPEPEPAEPEPPAAGVKAAAPAEQKVEEVPVPTSPKQPERATVSDALPTSVKLCMQCREASEHPETYCFGIPDGPVNPWGCRLSQMSWEPGAAWFELGHFRDDATFVFDKHAIAERLTARLASSLNCPHLDTRFAEAAFDCLPDRAMIGPRWQYRPADPDDENATPVRTTRYVHGCAVSTRVYATGVDPIGDQDALRVIQKASRRTSW
jgi:hypothetical protein